MYYVKVTLQVGNYVRLIYLNRDIDYFNRGPISEKGGVPSKLDFKFSAHSDKH